MAKPFSVKVLLERIRALLRRRDGSGANGNVLVSQGVMVDRERHRVTVDEKLLDLTPSEFGLLEALVRQPGRVFSRSELIDAALGGDSLVLERTIDVHIRSLRKKLGAARRAGGNGPRHRLPLPRPLRGEVASHLRRLRFSSPKLRFLGTFCPPVCLILVGAMLHLRAIAARGGQLRGQTAAGRSSGAYVAFSYRFFSERDLV